MEKLGTELAELMIQRGALEIMKKAREEGASSSKNSVPLITNPSDAEINVTA